MGYKEAGIKLESNGMELQAGSGFSDFKVYKIEGLTGLEFDFAMTNNPQSPNAIINNTRPLPREIGISIYCEGQHRQFLNSFFNPFVKGRLTVNWDGVSKWIEYYPSPVKIVQGSVYGNIKALITLICPEPYWKDMSDYGKNIASKRPLIAFPFTMLERGYIADYRIFKTEVGIANNGDVSVGAKIVFKALGEIINPKITLNGDKFLRVIVNMKKGDEIIFSTDIDDLYVTMNGEDILNKTDANMSFFQIPKGDNIIHYTADEGVSNMQVYVYYTPLYVGL